MNKPHTLSRPALAHRALLLCLGLALLQGAGCGGRGDRDAAPAGRFDASRVPAVVPKYEPKSRSGNPASYVVLGKRYHVMPSSSGYVEKGVASWYGTKFHGRRTSSGETYNMYALSAAHTRLPLPSYVRVTNLENGRRLVVRVNDRGPFHGNRIIDLSYAAAVKLGIVKKGTAWVEVRALQPGQTMPGARKVAAPAAGGAGFYIQVGAFRQRANAEKLRRRLKPLGPPLINISQALVHGQHAYRVRIGPLTDIALADAIVARLAHYGVLEHRIVVDAL